MTNLKPLFFPLLKIGLATGILMLSGYLFGQENETSNLPRFTYRSGQIIGELPYGQRFIIRGNTLQPGATQRADVVELKMYEEVSRTRRIRQQRRWLFPPDSATVTFGANPVYSSFWWNSEATDPARFELYVGRTLRINTYYRLELHFYQKYDLDDATTQRLIETVKVRIFDQNNLSVRVEDVENALNEVVREYAQTVDFGYLEPTANEQVRFDTSARRLTLPAAGELPMNLQLEIGKVLQSEQILADANLKLQGQVNELKLFARSDTFTHLYRNLEQALLRDTVAYRLSDLEALRGFVRTGDVSINPFPLLLRYAESPAGQRRLSELDQRVLQALAQNYFRPIQRLTDQRNRLLDQIALLNQQINEGGLDQLIAEGFVRANSAELIETPFTQLPDAAAQDGTNQRQSFQVGENDDLLPSTGYNAINLGTAYGVGLVGLNFPSPELFGNGDSFAATELNLISYIGVKFYFSQVDKALFIEDPYPLFRDRLSFMVGVRATGELNYRGRTFENVLAVQPVAALSLDLTRAMSFDAGFIFFGESALSPFQNITRLRAAPFVGLSLDANLFNAVKNLVTTNPNYRN